MHTESFRKKYKTITSTGTTQSLNRPTMSSTTRVWFPEGILRPAQSPIKMCTREFLLGLEHLEDEADCYYPSNNEVKDIRRFISTRPVCPHGICLDTGPADAYRFISTQPICPHEMCLGTGTNDAYRFISTQPLCPHEMCLGTGTTDAYIFISILYVLME
jgi:hypothetical protein